MASTMSHSPFHAGEHLAQTRMGKRDKMEKVGKIAIRPFMPDQHRALFEKLPFIVIGSIDQQGWPWASILTGGAGFMASPDSRHLTLAATPHRHDPLSRNLTQGAALGLLGLELATRRRNRMNAKVLSADAAGIALQVVQSFGNCPKYIQTRCIDFIRAPKTQAPGSTINRFTKLAPVVRDIIRASDTFFVSSYAPPKVDPVSEGVDVSHRGGTPGFIKVHEDTLTIPDYAGNNFFNTIGNFLTNPKAGLIFPDFETGDVYMLTGTVKILLNTHPDIAPLKGADQAWQFTLDHGLHIRDALPFRAPLSEASPFNPKA